MISRSFDSSSVSMMDYRPETKTLTLTFKSGGIYEYYQVPQETIDAFLACDSAGKFFHSNIKNKFLSSRRDSNFFVESYSELHGWIRMFGFENKTLAEAWIKGRDTDGVSYRVKQVPLMSR